MSIISKGLKRRPIYIPNYYGAGSIADHVAAGLILDLYAPLATGTGPNSNTGANKGIWKDLAGNYDTTLTNFGYATGSGWTGDGTKATPYGLAFDRVNDYGLVTSDGTGKFDLQAFTLDIWAYIDPSYVNNMLWSYDYTSHSNPYYACHLKIDTNRSLHFAFNSNGTTAKSITKANAITVAGIYHIVASFSQGYQFVMVNNKRIGQSDITDPIGYWAQPVWIGKANHANFLAAPDIFSVRYYNSQLSPAIIARNYLAGVA
jgi:hypothetical protein